MCVVAFGHIVGGDYKDGGEGKCGHINRYSELVSVLQYTVMYLFKSAWEWDDHGTWVILIHILLNTDVVTIIQPSQMDDQKMFIRRWNKMMDEIKWWIFSFGDEIKCSKNQMQLQDRENSP